MYRERDNSVKEIAWFQGLSKYLKSQLFIRYINILFRCWKRNVSKN